MIIKAKFLITVVCIFGVFLLDWPLMAQSVQTDMVILVDRSGSMKSEGGDPQGLSRAAVEFLLDQLELASNSNQAVLILFDSQVTPIPKSGLTSDLNQIRDQLTKIAQVGGNTDLEEALNEGLRFLASSNANKQMVLISDGKPEPDFNSNRATERFPNQLQKWREADSDKERRAIREKLSDLSTERIRNKLLGVLHEENIELYPIALTGIQPPGQKLLQDMANEVTRDANAFRKLQADDLISGLDTIVPKPKSLMNIQRATLSSADKSSWSIDFDLDSSLQKVRVLVLYEKDPKYLSWLLDGPNVHLESDQTGQARLVRARSENGDGGVIFDRVFLDEPDNGHYTLSFESTSFLPPMQVIIEGRTDLRLAVQSEPQPGEVGIPIKFFCRLAGKGTTTLHGASANIINEKGEYVQQDLAFSSASGKVLRASWTPSKAGDYRMNIRGYLDSEGKRYLHTRFPFLVQPQQAIELRVRIPVRQ